VKSKNRGNASEYARHRKARKLDGATHTAIQRATDSGRIKRDRDGQYDFLKCDAAWSANSRPHAKRSVARSSERTPEVKDQANNFAIARGVKEGYLAGLAKLQYEKQMGNLLPREDIRAAVERTLTQFKAKLLPIGDRLSAELAIESDPIRCREIVDSPIRDALTDLAKGLIEVHA
jgi:hypothetical protein